MLKLGSGELRVTSLQFAFRSGEAFLKMIPTPLDIE